VIQREDLRLRIFTHRSYFGRPGHVFEDPADDPSLDNEKLEHLGDSVLGLAVTSLLDQMFPGLRVGPSTKVRALIVGNINLADISVRYKLPQDLRLHPSQATTLRASINVQADVFESFVGGLYTDQGLASVQTWINELFRPYAEAAYDVVRAQHGLPPRVVSPTPSSSSFGTDPTTGHLALFNQHLQKSSKKVEWVYSEEHPFGDGAGASADGNSPRAHGNKTTPVWVGQVLVDNVVYGRGRGTTKKAAKNEAAKQGLLRMGITI